MPLVLLFVALVPAACVLWFMTVAMRNERLAVQQDLTGVYGNHLSTVQRQLTTYWKEKQAALSLLNTASPSEMFALIIRSNLATSAILHDATGKVVYPASTTTNVAVNVDEQADWLSAREQEFQKTNYMAAAEAYARIAQQSTNVHLKTRALQSQAGCLIKAGNKPQAVDLLAKIANDPSVRDAVAAQGTLTIPNLQLLLLKLMEDRSAEQFRTTLNALVSRLNDYSDPLLSASQRRFLMEEVQALDPSTVHFPTLPAEQLAAEYLERGGPPSTPVGLQTSQVPGVWRFATPDRAIAALFRDDVLRSEMKSLINAVSLPDVAVKLFKPQERIPHTRPVSPQDASELMPGWRIGLSFKGPDPFEVASARQTRIYLWTGSLVVLVTGLLALLVARFVSAQTRLTQIKNDLVSTVSHELKTPLASIRALVDTLCSKRYRNEQQLQDYLQLISKENQRLTHLIENFLTFSRMERGKQRFRFDELPPETIANDAIDALKEKLQSPQCQFESRIDPGLPRIRGDADALTTVVINLLDNAFKYTDNDKRIAMRAYANGRYVCFEVEDNGIGMNRNDLKKVFDRFYQVDQSLTRQRGGCGLGLSIVQYIVNAHDGAVEVESEPGKGSTFRVKVPLAERNGATSGD